VQAHTLGEVGILGTSLLRVYSGTVLPIVIEIGSHLTYREQKISWQSFFLRYGVLCGIERCRSTTGTTQCSSMDVATRLPTFTDIRPLITAVRRRWGSSSTFTRWNCRQVRQPASRSRTSSLPQSWHWQAFDVSTPGGPLKAKINYTSFPESK